MKKNINFNQSQLNFINNQEQKQPKKNTED